MNILKKIYKNIKENLPMIALIPTILGGIWQLYKLGSISVSMISFFSVSQLISDGIIILLYLTLPAFVLFPLFADIEIEENSERQKLKKKIWKTSIIVYTISVLICLSIITYKIALIKEFQNSKMLLKFTLFLDALLFGIIPLSAKWLRTNKTLLALTISLYLFLNCTAIFFALDNTSLNLNEVSNFNNLINKIKKEQSIAQDPKILYFNDKYIFIETVGQNKKSILIKKLDDIFN